MSKKGYIPEKLRKSVRDRAEGRCEYCLDLEVFAASSFHIDHIVSEQHEGKTEVENLAYSCGPCNLFKGPNLVTTLQDVEGYVKLFHPRDDEWSSHFRLHKGGSIVGITNIGKATLKLLCFNTVEQIVARKRLIELGLMEIVVD